MPRVGDRVRFRLWTTDEAVGVITHGPTQTADGRRLVWARIEEGPDWSIGQTVSLLAGEVEVLGD